MMLKKCRKQPEDKHDTSVRNGQYVPIQTKPEDDALQLHTD